MEEELKKTTKKKSSTSKPKSDTVKRKRKSKKAIQENDDLQKEQIIDTTFVSDSSMETISETDDVLPIIEQIENTIDIHEKLSDSSDDNLSLDNETVTTDIADDFVLANITELTEDSLEIKEIPEDQENTTFENLTLEISEDVNETTNDFEPSAITEEVEENDHPKVENAAEIPDETNELTDDSVISTTEQNEEIKEEAKEQLEPSDPVSTKQITLKEVWQQIKQRYISIKEWLYNHPIAHISLQTLFILIVLCSLFFVTMVGSNVAYMQYQYKNRLTEDETQLKVNRNRTWYMEPKKEYHALSYNIGFGAHTPEFSNRFENGQMENGKKTKGKYNFGISAEQVNTNMHEIQQYVKELDHDFYLFQNVDHASTRSYMIDQQEILSTGLSRYSRIGSPFQHSSYLFYPYPQERGLINSELLTYSRYKTTYGMVKKLPVNYSFFQKFSEPDYGFSVCWLPVANTDVYFVLINVQFIQDPNMRKAQLETVMELAKEEYLDGNYVMMGGTFNFDASVIEKTSKQKKPKWIDSITNYEITDGFRFVPFENETEHSSWRSADLPYELGTNYEAILDGFIVSDNITASAKILDTQFQYSNHNPIELTFQLQKQ
ncbi:MAG: hypothetical protein PUF50_06620 [Erysipelotrichaceae bacterium]|nr:hypothetical protein [Erysipelotrichaceae bacterium]